MKKFLLLLSLAILSNASAATETDPLWNKVLAQYKASNLWAPKEIRTQLDAERKDQGNKTSYIKSSLSGWEKQEAKYASINTDSNWQTLPEQKKSADAISKMLTGLDELKSSLFEEDVKIKRLENEVLDGKNLGVFLLKDDGAGKQISIKIWVNPETACMVKMNTSMHVTLYADAEFSTRYTEPAKEGLCFREQMQGNIDIQIPFKKGKMQIKQSNNDWIPKPAN
ncbi:hypothetical protein [Undibacterium sp. Di27W]|uniref:hypothetical protein n=1 Tax=Undibacterium sp. Di27W TaxID=3413036 RepID=UPI003BF579F2